MEIKASQADRFVAHPPASLLAALIYGADQGLVRERAVALAKTVVPDLADPFRVAELDETMLNADPARLWDEAAALSMIGGRRVVRVRGASNALADHFARFLLDPKGDALIVVEAGELAKSAALRRVFSENENTAAIPCYPDNERDLEAVVRAALKAEGLAIDSGVLESLVLRLGSDRGVTRSELEKLALYAMGEERVTGDHVLAVLGDESALRMDEALDAAGLGDYVRIDRLLSRLWSAGVSPATVLRQAMMHFQQLLLVKAESGNVAITMKKLRPPVFFMREQAFLAQVSRWTVAKLQDALMVLYEAEALARTTGVPEEAVCGRAFFSVAALANTERG